MKYPVRYATSTLRQVCETTVKVAATLLVCLVCLMATLRYFGVPVPSSQQFLHDVVGMTGVF